MTDAEYNERDGLRMKLAVEEHLALRRCDDVPGIVQLLASFYDSANFYFFMVSFTSCITLSQTEYRRPSLSTPEVTCIRS